MKHSPILNIKEELTMKIIKPSHTHISKKGLTPYQFVEKIGRTCYKSEDNITADSAVKFCAGLCSRSHFAMLEHYWVHMIVNYDIDLLNCFWEMGLLNYARYMYFTIAEGETYVSMPIRVFLETKDIVEAQPNPYHRPIINMWQSVFNAYPDIMQMPVTEEVEHVTLLDEDAFCYTLEKVLRDYCQASEDGIRGELMKHRTHTVLFVCDRGVSHELVRHRPCSFAQESTRYCNYSHDKFGEEITVILPLFFDTGMGTSSNSLVYEAWKYSCEVAERKYFELLNYGATPQEARSVLPNSLKTEIIMTCNETEWQHIINLRSKGTTGTPHPQMKEVMTPWYEDLKILSGGRVQ